MQSLEKGTLVTDSGEIFNVWQEHFETVFSKSVYLEHNRENDLLDSAKSIRDHHKQCKGDVLSEVSYLDAINIFEHLKNNKGPTI